ncbi:hypothetical protein [Aeromicrobium alkaliterrae]|uniref:Uncharacterized protein n=1 Tax=Aeromicrobium alkaliterrae TaxID=302168 RepID=A0ABP4WFP2_9ACTN
MPRLTVRRARWLTARAHLALLGWMVVLAPLVVAGLVLVLLALTGQESAQAGLGGMLMLWIGGWVATCVIAVWTYRRRIGSLVRDGDHVGLLRAEGLTAVRLDVRPIDKLAGVHLGGVEPNRWARAANSPHVLWGHGVAILVAVLLVAVG